MFEVSGDMVRTPAIYPRPIPQRWARWLIGENRRARGWRHSWRYSTWSWHWW